MNEITITSAQYIPNLAQDGNGTVIKATIDGIEIQVPTDPDNCHYQAILEWASQDGNTIADAD